MYSRIENASKVEQIEHPAVRAVLQHLHWDRGLEIHHDGDLPARSGMGSSSSFTVGLLHALYALRGRMPSKHQLMIESIFVEQEVIGETVGSQDQVSAAYGGLNHIVFQPNGEISVQPVTIGRNRMSELSSHLMLFYTGIKRTAANVADSFVQDLDAKKRQLRIMSDLVKEAIDVLTGDGDLGPFGELLHEAWLMKKSLSPLVSNGEVDDYYTRAQSAGAIGGKLTGAGGGGFLLLFAPPDTHERIKEELDDLIHVPFQFDFTGSQIVYFDHEQDYSEAEARRLCQTISDFRELAGVKVFS